MSPWLPFAPDGTGATTDLMAPVWADRPCQERHRADLAAWHDPHGGFVPRTIVLGYGADRRGGVACVPFGCPRCLDVEPGVPSGASSAGPFAPTLCPACECATAPIEPAWQAHVGAPVVPRNPAWQARVDAHHEAHVARLRARLDRFRAALDRSRRAK